MNTWRNVYSVSRYVGTEQVLQFPSSSSSVSSSLEMPLTSKLTAEIRILSWLEEEGAGDKAGTGCGRTTGEDAAIGEDGENWGGGEDDDVEVVEDDDRDDKEGGDGDEEDWVGGFLGDGGCSSF